jgi:hypothetical protein
MKTVISSLSILGATLMFLTLDAEAQTRYVDDQGQAHWVNSASQVPEKYRNADNSVTKPDLRAIKETNDASLTARSTRRVISKEEFDRALASGRVLEQGPNGTIIDSPLSSSGKGSKAEQLRRLDRVCSNSNSALCRQHNERQATKYLDSLEEEDEK